MKTIKPLKLAVLTRVYEHDRQFHLAVGVLAFVPLDAPRTLLADIALWPFAAKELGAEGVLDEAMPKARGEVLLTARAYPVGRRPALAVAPRVQVGALERTLHVVGNRRWQSSWITEPEPFLEVPIDWAHAFGGEGFADNPLGRGYVPPRGTPRELPNVEHTRKRVSAPGQRVAPVSFGPVPLGWPERMARAGTYDARWMKTLMPGFAADMDPTIFNRAQPEQWLEGYFRGDERFVLDHLHPDRPRIEGQLPGLAARVFVDQRRGDGALALRDLPTRLDTVHFFPHAERAVLVFRAVVRVVDDEASDVAHLMVASELLEQPRPREHYEAVLATRLDRRRSGVASLRDDDLVHPEAAGSILAAVGPGPVPPSEGLLRQNLQRRLAHERATLDAKLQAAGLDPARVDSVAPVPDADPSELERELAADPHAAMDRAKSQVRELMAQREAAMAQMRERLGALGIDADGALASGGATAGGPPAKTAATLYAQLDRAREAIRGAGASTAALDAKLADPALRARLAEADEKALEAYRRFGHHGPAAAPLAPQSAARLRAEVSAAHARGESLAARDLTGADLAGLDLAGADLSRALLEGANLAGTSLAGADLRDAVLARTDATGADFTGARMDGANLGGATLARARFGPGTSLVRAVFDRARFAGADLTGADLARASMLEADLTGAVLERVRFPGARFVRCTFGALRARGAGLAGATFIEGDLTGADFAGADLAGATFLKCGLERADFAGARADNARFVEGTRLAGARFPGAALERANLRGMDLSGADFTGAALHQADFSRALLAGATLVRVVAHRARFTGADLTDADMTSADLREAWLAKATVRGLTLTNANLFRADFARIRGGVRDMRGALSIDVRVTPRSTDEQS